jgi:hypothetical protein
MRTHKLLTHTASGIKTLCTVLVLMFMLGVVQLIAVELYWEFTRNQWDLSRQEKSIVKLTEEQKLQREIDDAQKEFAPDGTMYLVNYNVTSPGRFDETKMIVRDRQGQVLFTGKEENNPYTFIQWYPRQKNRYDYQSDINQNYLNELNLIGGEFSRIFVIPMVNSENKRIGHWFFDADKRIFSYYTISGRQEGYIGTNGYTTKKSEILGFEVCQQLVNWLKPDSYDPMMLYQTRYAVYQIDFQNGQVETLVQSDNDPIRKMTLNNWQETEKSDYRPLLSVITDSNKLYLRLKNPEQRVDARLPSDFSLAGTQFASSKDTIFARLEEIPGLYKIINNNELYMAWWKEHRGKPINRRVRLFEVDKAGTFSEKASFAWITPAIPQDVAYRTFPDVVASAINGLSSPVPLWLTGRVLKTGTYRDWPIWSRETMQFVRAYSLFQLPVNLCVMGVLAVMTVWHGWSRRTHIIRLLFWMVFVFLFNLPGLLTYLALNHTPVIHCVHCGKKRGLIQDACCRCGAALPLPKQKETDLIMPLSA